jgi:hypothetical protein
MKLECSIRNAFQGIRAQGSCQRACEDKVENCRKSCPGVSCFAHTISYTRTMVLTLRISFLLPRLPPGLGPGFHLTKMACFLSSALLDQWNFGCGGNLSTTYLASLGDLGTVSGGETHTS